MAMTIGGEKGMKAVINMAPMIDVLLVLLIIAMVILPLQSRGEPTVIPQAPQKPEHKVHEDTLVLEVLRSADGTAELRLNLQPIAWNELEARLTALALKRTEHNLFLQGSRELDFQIIAEVIDIAHKAGFEQVAPINKQIRP